MLVGRLSRCLAEFGALLSAQQLPHISNASLPNSFDIWLSPPVLLWLLTSFNSGSCPPGSSGKQPSISTSMQIAQHLHCAWESRQQEKGHNLVPDVACSAYTHKIQPGDTLFSIAEQYVVSFDDLIDANNDRQLDLVALPVGGVLNIPLHLKPRLAYTVRPGDDLQRIAQLTDVATSTILADNHQAMPLTPGTCLSLRTCPPSYRIG